MTSIEDKAKRLYLYNNQDAEPGIAELAWCDPEIRKFWVRQIEVVFGVTDD